MFTHTNTVEPLHIESVDGPIGRYYTTPEGFKYPSITTMLGYGDKPWLMDWRESLGSQQADAEMKRAATRGTAVHLMLENHLLNNPDPTKGHVVDHIAEFNSLKQYVKKINNIVLQEAALYSDVLKIAGRVDCIAEVNGVLSIIDFKTSTNNKTEQMVQDYYLQTTFYALAFLECYGIEIEDIVIFMSVEKAAVPLVFKTKVQYHVAQLVKRINKYYKQINGVS